MKYVIITLNVVALLALIGLRQFAHGYHLNQTEDAYQELVVRGVWHDAQSAQYADGWSPRARLQSIGQPNGFVQYLFLVGAGVCILNSAAILRWPRRKGTYTG
jgi:hypothetical protein